MVSALFGLAGELDVRAVIVPCTDLAVIGVARHREALQEHFLTSMPSEEVITRLMDKARFAEFAAKHGIPIPDTQVVRNRAEAESVARLTRYPCVLKPALKTTVWDARASAKALVAESRDDLLDLYDRHAQLSDTFVVQELIPGEASDHYTCDGYFPAEGEPLVTFSARKLRQWPPVVGQGCLSVECRNDEVRDQAVRLFRDAGHQGQGYVEAKWDVRTGRYVLIEANVGRPTGRSSAAETAGVELLMTMYDDLVGEPLPTRRVQRYQGSKWIYIRRDIQACVLLLYHRRLGLADVLPSWRGKFAFALFSWRDPVPFVADMVRAVRNPLSAVSRSLFKRFLSAPRKATRDIESQGDAKGTAERPVVTVALSCGGLVALRAGIEAHWLSLLFGG
jgi:predicted ATP-grasp superfamily ATP-dependent carboligase